MTDVQEEQIKCALLLNTVLPGYTLYFICRAVCLSSQSKLLTNIGFYHAAATPKKQDLCTCSQSFSVKIQKNTIYAISSST